MVSSKAPPAKTPASKKKATSPKKRRRRKPRKTGEDALRELERRAGLDYDVERRRKDNALQNIADDVHSVRERLLRERQVGPSHGDVAKPLCPPWRGDGTQD